MHVITRTEIEIADFGCTRDNAQFRGVHDSFVSQEDMKNTFDKIDRGIYLPGIYRLS